MQDQLWEAEWFLRALSPLFSHEDATCLVVCAVMAQRPAMSHVLLDLHGPIGPISQRQLLFCAARHGWWAAAFAVHKRCAIHHNNKIPHGHSSVQDILDVIKAAGAGAAAPTRSLCAVMWLQRRFPIRFPADVLYGAAGRGRLEEVIWLHRVLYYDLDHAIECAARGGHAQIIQWLLDQCNDVDGFRDLGYTCVIRLDDHELSDLGVISWRKEAHKVAHCFVTNVGLLPVHREYRTQGYPLLDWATANGEIALLTQLSLSNNNAVITNQTIGNVAISSAICGGHKQVVQWLLQNRLAAATEPELAEHLKTAATHGDLEIMQLIYHHHRGACWTNKSLDVVFRGACESGNLDLVKWLFENVTFRPPDLIPCAAKSGRLDLLQYLHFQRGYKLSVLAIARALSRNHLKLAKWIHSLLECRDLTSFDRRDMVVAVVNGGDLESLQWIIQELDIEPDFVTLRTESMLLAMWRPNQVASQQVQDDHRPLDDVEMLNFLVQYQRDGMVRAASNRGIVNMFLCPWRQEAAKWILRTVPEPVQYSQQEISDAGCFASLRRSYIQLDATTTQPCAPTIHPVTRRPLAAESTYELDDAFLTYRPRMCRQIAGFPLWAIQRGDLQWLDGLDAMSHPQLFTTRVASEVFHCSRNANVVLWFFTRQPTMFDRVRPRLLKWAARYGATSVLQRVFQTRLEDSEENTKWVGICAWAAATAGHVDVLQFLVARQPTASEAWWPRLAEQAASQGHLPVVQWLYENRERRLETKVTVVERIANAAVSNGHVRVLQWALSVWTIDGNGAPSFVSSKRLNQAVGCGHWPVIRWILNAQPRLVPPSMVGELQDEMNRFACDPVDPFLLTKCGNSNVGR